MRGKRTAIILGAGSSFCYGGGPSGLPTQQDIIGRLFFGADAENTEGFPTFSGPSGLMHSFPLAKYLRSRFAIPEDPAKRMSKMDFWMEIQKSGFHLESLYSLLEEELKGEHKSLLDDFESILRTAVLNPVRDRDLSTICPHHRRICEALEPGDYFINFNWDSVLTDTLLYYSHFWFPATGFGIKGTFPLLPPCQKSLPMESFIQVFQIHGSVVLFELDTSGDEARRGILYLGPRQWSPMTGLFELDGISPDQIKEGTGHFGERGNDLRNWDRFGHGHIYLRGCWFKPLFVPPSKYKPHYHHWFFDAILSGIHSILPSTEHFIVAGYSFPPADVDHLRGILVPDIVSKKATVEIINPENENEEFRQRVKSAFPRCENISFAEKDFKQFCANLPIEFPDRPSLAAKTATDGGQPEGGAVEPHTL